MLQPSTFRMKCSQYLTSARPISNIDHLKGRKEAHRKSLDALSSPGRHVFVYGSRGVGKTSLARTAVKSAQIHIKDPPLIACDQRTTFDSLFSDLMRTILNLNPLDRQKGFKIGGGLTVLGTGGNLSLEEPSLAQEFSVTSVNEAVSFVSYAVNRVGGEHIVIIDEFEFFRDEADHQRFAVLLKQLSERNIPLQFVVCGIADSIENVFSAHESVHRCIHAEKLERLKVGAGIEIVKEASTALEIGVPDYITYRIAQSSDGFHIIFIFLPKRCSLLLFQDNRIV